MPGTANHETRTRDRSYGSKSTSTPTTPSTAQPSLISRLDKDAQRQQQHQNNRRKDHSNNRSQSTPHKPALPSQHLPSHAPSTKLPPPPPPPQQQPQLPPPPPPLLSQHLLFPPLNTISHAEMTAVIYQAEINRLLQQSRQFTTILNTSASLFNLSPEQLQFALLPEDKQQARILSQLAQARNKLHNDDTTTFVDLHGNPHYLANKPTQQLQPINFVPIDLTNQDPFHRLAALNKVPQFGFSISLSEEQRVKFQAELDKHVSCNAFLIENRRAALVREKEAVRQQLLDLKQRLTAKGVSKGEKERIQAQINTMVELNRGLLTQETSDDAIARELDLHPPISLQEREKSLPKLFPLTNIQKNFYSGPMTPTNQSGSFHAMTSSYQTRTSSSSSSSSSSTSVPSASPDPINQFYHKHGLAVIPASQSNELLEAVHVATEPVSRLRQLHSQHSLKALKNLDSHLDLLKEALALNQSYQRVRVWKQWFARQLALNEIEYGIGIFSSYTMRSLLDKNHSAAPFRIDQPNTTMTDKTQDNVTESKTKFVQDYEAIPEQFEVWKKQLEGLSLQPNDPHRVSILYNYMKEIWDNDPADCDIYGDLNGEAEFQYALKTSELRTTLNHQYNAVSDQLQKSQQESQKRQLREQLAAVQAKIDKLLQEDRECERKQHTARISAMKKIAYCVENDLYENPGANPTAVNVRRTMNAKFQYLTEHSDAFKDLSIAERVKLIPRRTRGRFAMNLKSDAFRTKEEAGVMFVGLAKDREICNSFDEFCESTADPDFVANKPSVGEIYQYMKARILNSIEQGSDLIAKLCRKYEALRPVLIDRCAATILVRRAAQRLMDDSLNIPGLKLQTQMENIEQSLISLYQQILTAWSAQRKITHPKSTQQTNSIATTALNKVLDEKKAIFPLDTSLDENESLSPSDFHENPTYLSTALLQLLSQPPPDVQPSIPLDPTLVPFTSIILSTTPPSIIALEPHLIAQYKSLPTSCSLDERALQHFYQSLDHIHTLTQSKQLHTLLSQSTLDTISTQVSSIINKQIDLLKSYTTASQSTTPTMGDDDTHLSTHTIGGHINKDNSSTSTLQFSPSTTPVSLKKSLNQFSQQPSQQPGQKATTTPTPPSWSKIGGLLKGKGKQTALDKFNERLKADQTQRDNAALHRKQPQTNPLQLTASDFPPQTHPYPQPHSTFPPSEQSLTTYLSPIGSQQQEHRDIFTTDDKSWMSSGMRNFEAPMPSPLHEALTNVMIGTWCNEGNLLGSLLAKPRSVLHKLDSCAEVRLDNYHHHGDDAKFPDLRQYLTPLYDYNEHDDSTFDHHFRDPIEHELELEQLMLDQNQTEEFNDIVITNDGYKLHVNTCTKGLKLLRSFPLPHFNSTAPLIKLSTHPAIDTYHPNQNTAQFNTLLDFAYRPLFANALNPNPHDRTEYFDQDPPLKQRPGFNLILEHPFTTAPHTYSIPQLRSLLCPHDYSKTLPLVTKPTLSYPPCTHFHDVEFSKSIMDALAQTEFKRPTPVQSALFPTLLCGNNCIAAAPSGSGKTLGYILPAIVHLRAQTKSKPGDGPIVVVLAPAANVAAEIHREISTFTSLLNITTLLLDEDANHKAKTFTHKSVDILVSTPQLLFAFAVLHQDHFTLTRVSYFVLEEPELAYNQDDFAVYAELLTTLFHPDRQSVISTTEYTDDTDKLAQKMCPDADIVHLGQQLNAFTDVKRTFEILAPNLPEATRAVQIYNKVIKKTPGASVLVFVSDDNEGTAVVENFRAQSIPSTFLSSKFPPHISQQIIKDFISQKFQLLVLTDDSCRRLQTVLPQVHCVISVGVLDRVDTYCSRLAFVVGAKRRRFNCPVEEINEEAKSDVMEEFFNQYNQMNDSSTSGGGHGDDGDDDSDDDDDDDDDDGENQIQKNKNQTTDSPTASSFPNKPTTGTFYSVLSISRRPSELMHMHRIHCQAEEMIPDALLLAAYDSTTGLPRSEPCSREALIGFMDHNPVLTALSGSLQESIDETNFNKAAIKAMVEVATGKVRDSQRVRKTVRSLAKKLHPDKRNAILTSLTRQVERERKGPNWALAKAMTPRDSVRTESWQKLNKQSVELKKKDTKTK